MSSRATRGGRQPYDGLAFDRDGNLYGATSRNGNPTCDCGTVFKLAPERSGEWHETNLHIFEGSGDGAAPRGRVILDTTGNVYGTTTDDGWGLCTKSRHNLARSHFDQTKGAA